MKESCERCGAVTSMDGEAWICNFECTFCGSCAAEMENVCPNCGGELTPRPRRRLQAATGQAGS